MILQLAALSLVSAVTLSSAPPEWVATDQACTFFGDPLRRRVLAHDSDAEAKQIVQEIVDSVGLSPHFRLRAARIGNAAAVLQGSKRYVLYSPRFIKAIANRSDTDWAGVSILAHEIGHHLNGHTLDRRGSRPGTELEADEFSGFVLARLGATLEEAQAPIKVVGSRRGSKSHPPRAKRLEAIERGWKRAHQGVTHTVAARKPREEEARELRIRREMHELVRHQDTALGRTRRQPAPRRTLRSSR